MTTMMTKKSRSACSISKSDPLLGDQLTAVFVAFGLLFFYFGGIGCFNPTLCFTSRPGAKASASTFLCQQRSATSLCNAFGSLQAHLQLGENLVCSGPLRVADTACFCLLLQQGCAKAHLSRKDAVTRVLDASSLTYQSCWDRMGPRCISRPNGQGP